MNSFKPGAAIGTVSKGHPAVNSDADSKRDVNFSMPLKDMLQRVIDNSLDIKYEGYPGHGDKFFRIDGEVNFLIKCSEYNVTFIKDQVITALQSCFPNQDKEIFKKEVTSYCMSGTGRLSHVKIDVSDLKTDIQKNYPDMEQVVKTLNEFCKAPAAVVAKAPVKQM